MPVKGSPLTPAPRPLLALLITDGKPGHESLSDGILAALARSCSIARNRLEVARPRWLPPRALSALTSSRSRLLPRLLGLDLAALPRPDIIVSAGGDTLAANVITARHFACPNVFYGSLRRYPPDDFALVLTSYAEHASRPNIAMSLKPSARDPDTLPLPPRHIGHPIHIGVLIGGDSGTIGYTGADWDHLLALLAQSNPASVCLTVANSRRTPDAVSDRIAALAATGTVGFVDVRTAGPGTLGPLFAASHAILATVDSSSMISEAVWARRPVVVLTPERWSLPASEQGYRNWMAANGWTTAHPLAQASTARLMAALEQTRPLTTNPLDDLATLIQQRLSMLSRG